jgi:hypothetical protein
VKAALNVFGLLDVELVDQSLSRPFRGLAHSYVLQRRLVDAVDGDELVATGSERLF